MFKAKNKYQTPERHQVHNNDFKVNFQTYFSSRFSAFIVNSEQIIAGFNKSVFN